MGVGDLEQPLMVPAGKDRFGEDDRKIWGFVPLATKVSAKDTGGAMFAFEHRAMGKGGPPRHVHHDQDEWFYVVQGEYLFEIGETTYRLRAGDSCFAPRRVPHVWAHVGDGPGTVITVVSPVGTFEKFMHETTDYPTLPSEDEIAQAFADNNMTVVGPPLKVD